MHIMTRWIQRATERTNPLEAIGRSSHTWERSSFSCNVYLVYFQFTVNAITIISPFHAHCPHRMYCPHSMHTVCIPCTLSTFHAHCPHSMHTVHIPCTRSTFFVYVRFEWFMECEMLNVHGEVCMVHVSSNWGCIQAHMDV